MKQVEFRMEFISPYCLARMVLHNLWMVIASAVICALAVSMLLTWTYEPQYKASMTYAVNSRMASTSSAGSLTATREVTSVLSELLTTDLIYEGIRSSDPRLVTFDGSIIARQVPESNFIEVSTTAKTPEQAFMALTALIEVFPNVAGFISGRSVLHVMKIPSVTTYPVNANNAPKMAMLAGIAGAAAMFALLCYICIQRGTVQTRTGARQLLDAPIVASLSHEWKNRTLKTALRRTNKHVQVFSPTISYAYSEQINTICSQMEHEANHRGARIFLTAGIGESEGKSTVAGNVAAALAMKGHKVALLDCDLRKPNQNKFFDNVYQAPLPLNKLLSKPFNRENLENCIQKGEKTGLHLLLPVKSDSRSAELLAGPTMNALLAALVEDNYDYIVVDTPPMGMFPDTEILADKVDATLLVVRQDYVPVCDINDAIDTLRRYKANFLGVILNDMMASSNHQYGYGSRYGYGHSRSHDHASESNRKGDK